MGGYKETVELKKIYIRAGVLPYEEVTPIDCLTKNIIGGNSGNLFYQYSMVKALSIEGIEFIPNRYKIDLNDVDWINEECSAFVIPLADAFREDFIKELNSITELVKRLKIPCIVTGVGVRAPFEPDFSKPFSFNEDVKKFVNAVLDKSPMLGLRGELTAEYLKSLGFKEEKHFTVIGCPSLYMNGEQMKIREVNLKADSKVNVSSIPFAEPVFERFIKKICEKYQNHYFVGQLRRELRLLYTGYGFEASKFYPCNNSDADDYQNGNARFFINVPSWLEHMSNMDLSIGSRFHGTVAGLVAGTPSILIADDARKREFMMYHKMPGIASHEITEDLTLEDVVASVDFSELEANHKKNFEHFTSFLDVCGLKNIYTEPQEKDYFQEKMSAIKIEKGIEPLLEHSNETFRNRVKNSYDWLLETELSLISDNKLLMQWMKLKNKGKSTYDFFQANGYQKIVCYGINEFTQLLYDELLNKEDIHMEYIIDPKSGQVFHGLEIRTIEECELQNIDVVVVTKDSSYTKVNEKIGNRVKVFSLIDIIKEIN